VDEIRVGVIGAGGMGAEHARNLAAIDGVKVVTVADAILDAAEALAFGVGAVPTTDALGLIASAEVDAVVIASPDETHGGLAIASVHARKPTLCEKPLATTVTEAEAVMRSEVEGGRRFLQLGLMREFDPVHQQLMLDLAVTGGVRHVRAVHRNRNEVVRPTDHAISQSMVHDVHTVRWLAKSEFVSVHARMIPRGGSGVRFVTVSALLESGALASLEFDDHAFGYDVSVEVSGVDGFAQTPAPSDPSQHDDWFAWFADAYRLEADAWIESISQGLPVGPSAWDGVATQSVVEAIQISLRSGREEPVSLPPRPDLY